MITLKIIKAILPICDVINSKKILSVSEKLTTLGLFFAENKVLKKNWGDCL